jgi:predicted dehydrogenase
MERLKVGIIGTGMAFERLHHPAYQELRANYQIVALC